jgi:outer membrane protein
MKNLSLILNVVLLIAVSVLYYLQFSNPKSTSAASSSDVATGSLQIAFINADSVLKNYDYFKVSGEKFESKKKKLDQDLRNRAQSFQNDYAAYQQNVGNLTIGQAKAIEEDLAKKQQNLQMYQESLSQELMGDQSKMTQELYGKVTDFLKKYGKEKGIQIVFKYDPGSDLLFGGDALDISKDVITGLNASYKQELANPKVDSTKTKK